MSSQQQIPFTDERWPSVALGDCARLFNGRAYRAAELLEKGKVPVLRVGNLFTSNHWYYSDMDLEPQKYCEAGDLLYAWSASFGPYIWTGPKAIYHYHIWRIIPGPELDKQYCYHLLQWITEAVRATGHGIAMMHVTKAGMEKWRIPLPPLAEQKRIAGILKEQLAAVQRARAAAEAQLEAAKALPAAYLRDVFSDNGWPLRPFGEVVENHDGRRIPLKLEDRNERKGKFPYYGASGIIDYIDDYLYDGEFLLIAEDGANLVARSTPIAFKAAGKFWVNNHAHVVQPKDGILLDYLIHWFAQVDISRYVTGAAQPKFSQAKLNELPVPVPTTEEQTAIVSSLNARCESVDALRSAIQGQMKEIDAMPATLLRAAFQGRL